MVDLSYFEMSTWLKSWRFLCFLGKIIISKWSCWNHISLTWFYSNIAFCWFFVEGCALLPLLKNFESSVKIWLASAFCSQLNEVLLPNPFDRPDAVFVLEVTGVKGQYCQLRRSVFIQMPVSSFSLFLRAAIIWYFLYRISIIFCLLK